MDYKEKYENLLRENNLLFDYIQSYQAELEKYAGRLDKLDKCTEKDTYFENLDLKKRQERQELVLSALWESIGWLAEEKEWSFQKILKKLFCAASPKHIYFLALLLTNNYRSLKSHHEKFGVDKTINLLECLPLISSVKARIWTELARHCRGRDNKASLAYSILAWRAEPRAYRLKFLAFNMHRNGEDEKALAILEGLPREQTLSDSEMRLFAKIKALSGHE